MGTLVECLGYFSSQYFFQNIYLFPIKLPASVFATLTAWCVSDLLLPPPQIRITGFCYII